MRDQADLRCLLSRSRASAIPWSTAVTGHSEPGLQTIFQVTADLYAGWHEAEFKTLLICTFPAFTLDFFEEPGDRKHPELG